METICDDSPRVKVYSITELTHLCDLEVSLPHTPKLQLYANIQIHMHTFFEGEEFVQMADEEGESFFSMGTKD